MIDLQLFSCWPKVVKKLRGVHKKMSEIQRENGCCNLCNLCAITLNREHPGQTQQRVTLQAKSQKTTAFIFWSVTIHLIISRKAFI